MRFAAHALAMSLLLAITAFCYLTSASVAADATTIADTDKVYLVSYRITDMPVWSEDGKTFNPTILMAYLKTKLTPEAWTDSSKMAPYPQNKCLVISTTSANHDSIRTVLDSLRADIGAQAK